MTAYPEEVGHPGNDLFIIIILIIIIIIIIIIITISKFSNLIGHQQP